MSGWRVCVSGYEWVEWLRLGFDKSRSIYIRSGFLMKNYIVYTATRIDDMSIENKCLQNFYQIKSHDNYFRLQP